MFEEVLCPKLYPPLRIPHAVYIGEASIADVLFEQLEFLTSHRAAHRDVECSPACEDCLRLQMVRNWLLLPFRESTH
jgi:hypothetical protein